MVIAWIGYGLFSLQNKRSAALLAEEPEVERWWPMAV